MAKYQQQVLCVGDNWRPTYNNYLHQFLFASAESAPKIEFSVHAARGTFEVGKSYWFTLND